MNLYEIDERLAACVTQPDGQVVDVETGEIIDTAAIEALQVVAQHSCCCARWRVVCDG
jgi:hypothetical protein